MTEADREVEFHDIDRDVKYLLCDLFSNKTSQLFDFKSLSCEQIATEILLGSDSDVNKLPPLSAVEVWEDGEFGARVERSS